MNYSDFTTECKRLDAIKIPKNDTELTERRALEQELWRKYSWMITAQWQATVSWVIDKHKGKALPVVNEFGAAVGMMREKGVIKTEACRSCDGIKMQFVRVRHTLTGREFDACKPCTVCMIASDWEIKRDLEVIGEARNKTALRMAHEMTPQGAYWAINRAEAAGMKWDPDVEEVLANKAIAYGAEIENRKSQVRPAAKDATGLMVGILSNVKVTGAVSGEAAAQVAVGNPPSVSINGEEYEVDDGQV